MWRRHLSIVDTGNCEAPYQAGCQPLIVLTGCLLLNYSSLLREGYSPPLPSSHFCTNWCAHRVIILLERACLLNRIEGNWFKFSRPECVTSQRDVTRAWRHSLANWLVGGGGVREKYIFMCSAFPGNCRAFYLFSGYGGSLWAELNGGENSLHWKANMLPLFSIMTLWVCFFFPWTPALYLNYSICVSHLCISSYCIYTLTSSNISCSENSIPNSILPLLFQID